MSTTPDKIVFAIFSLTENCQVATAWPSYKVYMATVNDSMTIESVCKPNMVNHVA